MATKNLSKTQPAAPQKPAVELNPNRPYAVLVAQATDKYPQADPNPIGHLGRIASDLEKRIEQLDLVFQLTEMDDQNPIVIGADYFATEIMKEINKDAEMIRDIRDTLHLQEQKGGAA